MLIVETCLTASCSESGCIFPPSSGPIEINPDIAAGYHATADILDPTEKYNTGTAVVIQRRKGKKVKAITARHIVLHFLKAKQPTLPLRICYLQDRSNCKTERFITVAIDKEADLAIIESVNIALHDGIEARIANKMSNLGDTIWIIGSNNRESRQVAKGTLAGYVTEKAGDELLLDANVYNGDSGGGVFNENNEVIGIVSKYTAHPIDIGFVRVPGGPIPGSARAVGLVNIRRFLGIK